MDALAIRGFLAHLFEHEKKKSSIGRKLAAVRAFFKFLAKEGVLAANPAATVSTPKLDKTLPRIMTEEEMNNFLNRVAEAVQAGEPMMRRDRAILELLYASGLRVSEVGGSRCAQRELRRQHACWCVARAARSALFPLVPRPRRR